jgi:hypothetical protein
MLAESKAESCQVSYNPPTAAAELKFKFSTKCIAPLLSWCKCLPPYRWYLGLWLHAWQHAQHTREAPA